MADINKPALQVALGGVALQLEEDHSAETHLDQITHLKSALSNLVDALSEMLCSEEEEIASEPEKEG